MSRYELHPVPTRLRPFVRALWTLDAPAGEWSERVPASPHHLQRATVLEVLVDAKGIRG